MTARAIEFSGRTASDGLFAGPIWRIGDSCMLRPRTGSPDEERKALANAIAASAAEIADLIARSAGEAGDILAFQLAILEDDALTGQTMDGTAAGAAADLAWRQALDEEIAAYACADDEYFRARAADLRDIRDRVLCHLSGMSPNTSTAGAILTGEDLAPSRFLETDWSRGGAIALASGSPTSHVAMLARSRGIPMIVGLGPGILAEGADHAIVDADRGLIILGPGVSQLAAFEERVATRNSQRAEEDRYLLRPALRRDGSSVDVLVNIADPAETARIDVRCCAGVGLMRSEFLFRNGAALPSEEEQYHAYRKLVTWAEGRPVTIRTLDAGGDKPISGLTLSNESNPFLGLRGVRLTLARTDVFRVQLRALARAAACGPLKIMLPMVTAAQELDQSVTLLDRCVAELRREGIPCCRPDVGIMVEVPAAAIAPELFGKAAFFSIGTNDLTQYVTAVARGAAEVAEVADEGHPAILKLIRSVADFGKKAGIPVSVCGDMASDPRWLPALLEAGIATLSVAPARVCRVKSALAEI